MKFTIGTVSKFQEYEEEIKLIKASLLYADDIELIGITEYIVYMYLSNVLDGNKEIDALLQGIIDFLRSVQFPNKEETLQKLETAQLQLKLFKPKLKNKRHRSHDELLAQIRFNQLKSDLKPEFENALHQFVDGTYSQELQKLIDNNIVSVFDYQMQCIDINELLGSYLGSMMKAIYATHTYPLFDEKSTGFISSIAKTKIIDINNLNPAVIRHAGIATNILMTLPTFENARIDELLDFKKQNVKYLKKFRNAIYDFSEKISSLPWNDDFQYDCIKLYHTEVVPQVEEINEVLTETSILKSFGKKVFEDEEVRKNASFAIGGLATAITTSNTLTGVINQIIMATSLAILSKELFTGFCKAIDLWNQSQEENEEKAQNGITNRMYYYYLAQKRLK